MKQLLLLVLTILTFSPISFAQSCPTAPGNPATFGTNQWNVYAYNSGDGTIPGTDWTTNYSGYYTTSTLNFQSDADWSNTSSPSSAANYQGCTVGSFNHSYSAKRQGFPCGYYSLSIPYHDDAVQVFINGTKVFEHDACCDNHADVWGSWLGATDQIEFRVSQAVGGSAAALTFSKLSDSVIYVNATAASGGNGATWATAFNDLQNALAAAGSNSCVKQIWVAKGTYTPTVDPGGNLNPSDPRTRTFVMRNGVAIYGGFAGNETLLSQRNWNTNPTILSGERGNAGTSDNCYRVFNNTFTSGSPLVGTAVLDGFTIQDAYADGTFPLNLGGGMWNSNASPTVRNCTFRNNFAGAGAALFNDASSATVVNCLFINNTCSIEGAAISCGGGSAGARIINCTIYGNTGPRVLNNQSAAGYTNCIIWGNSSNPSGTGNITYSIVQGGYSGTGNRNVDPQFIDVANGNFRIPPCSPGFNTGDNAAIAGVSTDLDGNPRIFNNGLVDMGAYEVQGTGTPRTIYVNQGVAASGDGSSWATAFKTLQEGLEAVCTTNDQIWVAKGTYYPTADRFGNPNPSDPRNKTFVLRNGVSMYGSLAGNEPANYNMALRNFTTNATILSGDIDGVPDVVTGSGNTLSLSGNGGNAYNVINNFFNSLTVSTSLNGFTVKGGNSNLNFPFGGGLFGQNLSLNIVNCTFRENRAEQGGALYFSGTVNIDSTIFELNLATILGGAIQPNGLTSIKNSVIRGNLARSGGGVYIGMGPANDSFTCVACQFVDNGTTIGQAAGLYTARRSRIINCRFDNNISPSNAGGLYFEGDSITIANSSFTKNRASTDGAVLFANNARVVATNCQITGNICQNGSGGITNNRGDITLVNCTIANNTSGGITKAIWSPNSGAQMKLENTIVASNVNGNIGVQNGATVISQGNNLIDDNSSGFTNGVNGDLVNVSPKFVSATDFRLQPSSPAVNAGDNSAIAGFTTDLDGKPRIQLGTVDMGAYETSCQTSSDPTVFGTNQWNVYAYNSGDGTIPGTNWLSEYRGYYTTSTLNFQSDADWSNTSSPSSAANYQGCTVGNFNHSYSAKRQGFPCGYYSLSVPYHDDAAQLFVNNVKVWEHDGCCDSHTGVWGGWLGANDKLEFRVSQGLGGSAAALTFSKLSDSIIYVNATAASGGNGATWATAFNDLQSALAAAGSNSCVKQIWVAKGTYTPTADPSGNLNPSDPRIRTFVMRNGVAIYGGFAGTETLLSQRNWNTNPTILSGERGNAGTSDNCYRVINNNFTAGAPLLNTAILDGVIIEAAYANAAFPLNLGGGMWNSNASPTVRNCTFRNNFAGAGAALFNDVSSATIVNCLFINNSCSIEGAAISCGGGAAGVRIINCTIYGNTGTRVLNNQSAASYTNCIIWGNSSNPSGTGNITYSVVQGGYSGTGNFAYNPRLIDPANGNYRLPLCSPAVNAGSNAAISGTSTDIDGNPRIFNNGIADMGAYEAQGTATPKIVYVNQAVSISGDGSSWATAVKTLQEGLEAVCGSGDQIWVAKGTYYPTADPSGNTAPTDMRTKTFVLRNGVTMYGGLAGNEPANYNMALRDFTTNATVLSGDIDGVPDTLSGSGSTLSITGNSGNAYNVINNNITQVSSYTTLDGFTVTGGNANGGSPVTDNGGGISGSYALLTVSNCTIIGNVAASRGGGISCSGGLTKMNLSVVASNRSMAERGGGIFCDRSLILDTCKVRNNRASSTGGGISSPFLGGAVEYFTLNNCDFTGNYSDAFGGGISSYRQTSISSCRFINNAANIGGAINSLNKLTLSNSLIRNNTASFQGGGLNIQDLTNSVIVNCEITGNVSQALGGAISFLASSFNNQLSVINSTIAKNTSLSSVAFLVSSRNSRTVAVTLTSNVLANNSIGSYGHSGNPAFITLQAFNNLFDDNSNGLINGVNGNLMNTNPLFESATDFRLQPASPGINAGDNSAVASIPNDLAGNARIQLGTVDMGAYEASCKAEGNPTTFGNNQWNVYVYRSGDGTLGGTDWQSVYSGYYTSSALNFVSDNDWAYVASPSTAATYQGCPVRIDSFSFVAKRKGFPCGYYSLDVPIHDDASQLFINGVKVWEHDGCCDSHTGVWAGILSATDSIEFRTSENAGGAASRLLFNFTPAIWYLDADSDGYYTGSGITGCTSPGAGYTLFVTGSGDCNDNNSAVNPGATEVCNGIDDDCDGQIDEGTTIAPQVVVSTPACTMDLSAATGNNALPLSGSLQYAITPDLTTQFSSTSFTMEVWFKANADGVIVAELGEPIINVNWHTSHIELLPDNHVRVRVWPLASVDLGTVSLGTWNHAAVRYNAATNTLDGLLNGVPSATTVTGVRQKPSAQYWAFGALDGTNMGSGKFFNGQLDEIRIWNRAISNAQVLANYNKTIAANATGLVAYYKADEASGSVLTDATSNALHGTVVNTLNRAVPSDNALNAVSYLWSNAATTQAITTSTGGSFFVKTTVSPNCQATSATVNVAPSTPVVAVSNNGPICSGNTAIFTLTGTPGALVTYQVSNAPVQTDTLSAGGTATVTLPNATANKVFRLLSAYQPYSNCTQNIFQNDTVVVKAFTTPFFTAAPSANVCSGFDVVYTVQPGMSNYQWTIPGAIGTDYTISAGGTGTGSNTVTLKWLTAGPKTVSINFANANGCVAPFATGTSTTVATSVAPAVTIAITGGSNPVCRGGNITFTATATNGGTSPGYRWFSNGLLVASSNANTYTSTNITASTAVYAVLVPDNNICVTKLTDTSNIITINPTNNSWTGGYSNVWGDSRNWCAGVVPTATSDAEIPVTSRNPVVTANASVKNITIAAGASVGLNNAMLIVNGTVAGTGTFSGSGNNGLTLTATGNVGTLYFAPSGIGTLSLTGAGASAALGNATNLYRELSIGSATLNTAGHLTLKSDINGTACVAPITGGSITGNVTVERYIPQNAFRAWRLLSVPTQTTQTIHQAWQEGQSPMVNGVPGFGTLITSATGGNGFDTQTTGNSMLSFTNGNPGTWTGVSGTANPLATRQGYMLYVRGDRSVAPSAGVFYPTPTTLRTTGPLYQGAQPVVNLTAANNVLIGNVYAAPIDFTKLVKSGVTSFKVWDPKLQGGYNVGAYQTFSQINGFDPIPGGGSYGNSANTVIESGQAFIVNAPAGGTIQLVETAKATGSRNVFRTTGAQVQQLKTQLLANTANGLQLADGNAVVFDPHADNGIDEADAIKANNFGENIAIRTQGVAMSLESRKLPSDKDEIIFHISNLKKQDYQLTFIPQQLNAQGLTAYLFDRYSGQYTPVSLMQPTIYPFSVTSDIATAASDRFKIVFSKPVAPMLTIALTATSLTDHSNQLTWTTRNEQDISYYEVASSTDGNTFAKLTTVAANNNANASYQAKDEQPKAGDNFYRVKAIHKNGSYVFSNVVKVTTPDTQGDFVLFPNPVVDNKLTIHFKAQPKGLYSIRLINKAGQTLLTRHHNHGGGNSSAKVVLPSTLATGSYQVAIYAPSGERTTKNIVVSKQ